MKEASACFYLTRPTTRDRVPCRDPHLRSAFSLHARTREKDPTLPLQATGRKMFTICIIKANG
jgi:hypothetical protein